VCPVEKDDGPAFSPGLPALWALCCWEWVALSCGFDIDWERPSVGIGRGGWDRHGVVGMTGSMSRIALARFIGLVGIIEVVVGVLLIVWDGRTRPWP
jgi:hypothetical protein